MSPRFSLSLETQMDYFHWQETALRLLAPSQNDEALAREITLQIIEAQKRSELRHTGDRDRRVVLGTILQRYAESCFPLVGDFLLSPNYYQMTTVLGGYGFDDHKPSILWNLPAEYLAAWARANPAVAPRLLGTMGLFTADESGGYCWHPTTLALVREGIDAASAKAIGGNLFSYGSTGSRVPYIEKRIKLLHQLDQHPAVSVREMARHLINVFEDDKAHEMQSDQEEAAGIY